MAPKDPNTALERRYVPGNILDRLTVVEETQRGINIVDAPTQEDITDGRVGVYDLMISPAEGIITTDPTDATYTGWFVSGNGLEFDGIDYVAGNVIDGEIKTGFTTDGTIYAIDAVISGTVVIGPGSSAGGWLIDATHIYNANISLDSSLPAIKIGSATAIMTGAGVYMGNDSGTYKLRIGNPAGNYLLWDGSILSANGQWIKSAGMNPALQEWETNIVFSSASDTQVNWTSGSIRLSDGTSYTISSGNTGTMAALTYIYLDIAVSSTVLQTTTTYTTATGDGKILVAAAQNNTAGASVMPMGGQQPIINGGVQITALSILAGNIAAGAITATKISVTSLSAITATMGALTIDSTLTMSGASGAITIGTTPPSSSTTGTGLWIDRTGVYSLSSNVQNATLTSAGLTAGAGNLVLDSSGLTLIGGVNTTNTIKFIASVGGDALGYIYGDYTNPERNLYIEANPLVPTSTWGHLFLKSRSSGIYPPDIYMDSIKGAVTNRQHFDDTTIEFNALKADIDSSLFGTSATALIKSDGGNNTLSFFGGTAIGIDTWTTFTPTIVGTTSAGTGTYSNQVGIYWVRGDFVWFAVFLVWTAHTGTGNMRISNLPYTILTGANYSFSIAWNNITLATATNKLMALGLGATNEIALQEIAGGAAANVPIDTAATLYVQGFYRK